MYLRGCQCRSRTRKVSRVKIELKPCPFCGKEISAYSLDCNQYGVERLVINCCMEFDIESDDVMSSSDGSAAVRVGKDAVEKWNRRAGEQDELRS